MKSIVFIAVLLMIASAGPSLTAESFEPGKEFPDPPTAGGELLYLTGRVLTPDGSPAAGATVEIWQTDAEGIYDHPGEGDRAARDRGFQFFGSDTVDADGRYRFRTLLPGAYGSRPPHIHVKVRLNGRTVLTTQFYFDRAGAPSDLVVDLGEPAAGGYRIGEFDLVIPGAGEGRRPTRRQAEGPYYPVVDPGRFDNDLARVGD